MKISYQKRNQMTGQGAALWFRRFLGAWMGAAAVEYLLLEPVFRDLSNLAGLTLMSPVRMVLVAVALLGVLGLIRCEVLERWLPAASFACLAVTSLTTCFSWAYLAACLLIGTVLICYSVRGWNGEPETICPSGESAGAWRLLVMFGAVVFFLLVSIWTVCRVRCLMTPSYDFSIFAQMFHSMRTTGLPVTTIERDGPLSHFAVHVSPVFYLMLPFYCLVPRPETLQVLQAAVLASAVIPLWKLGRLHGLHPVTRALLCLVLLLYPAYAGGTSYDIHENAFLTPLILWLLYGIDRKKPALIAPAAVLTLMVKEDAAVYVAVIALYLMVRAVLRKDRNDLVTGVVMLAGSLVYFFLVTGYLASSGDGVMTYRYKNFMYDGSGSLVTVVKAVLLSPMKAVYECVDPEKLKFIAMTLLPLAGLPLLTRRFERFLLLIPYLLVNLMSDYQYQHDIMFQYTYGATACLVYLTLVNLADMRMNLKMVTAAVCISAMCFGGSILPVAVKYPTYCIQYADYYDALRETLDVIPEGAPAAGTTYFTTWLSQRETLYDVRYASREHLLECDYVAVNPKDGKAYSKYGDFDGFVEMLEENGYELIAKYASKLQIYQKK